MTKKEWDKLKKENLRSHLSGRTPHPRSERSIRYKQSRGILTEERDPLKYRKPGDAARSLSPLRAVKVLGGKRNLGPHIRRALGIA